MTPAELALFVDQLGIPNKGTTIRYLRQNRAHGWEQEVIGVVLDSEPAPRPWPWMNERDEHGEVVQRLQVWWAEMHHLQSGFRLARRWHPDMGPKREWSATSPGDGTFGLLGEARGLFRHSGRPVAIRGPEQIREAIDRLSKATGKPPTTAQVARDLGITVATLRIYAKRWGIDLG